MRAFLNTAWKFELKNKKNLLNKYATVRKVGSFNLELFIEVY
jgi:hypothetical protein